MNLAITHQEFTIICSALPGGSGISKLDRKAAESLRDRLVALSTNPPRRPEVGLTYTPMRSGWPTTVTKKEHKRNWSYHKPRQPKAVSLNNTTTPENEQAIIDELLDGII